MAVQDLERLFTFTTSGGNGDLTRNHAGAIINGFRTVFFHYLNGIGHVPGTMPDHVSEEEYSLRASDPLFRAKVTLRQLTDSWLLPVGDDPENKIKVRGAVYKSSPLANPTCRSPCNLRHFSRTMQTQMHCQYKSQHVLDVWMYRTRNGFTPLSLGR